MTQKTRVGGVIFNDRLGSISVLAVRDRPGTAASVFDSLGQRNLNVQFVVQVIDHRGQDQIVLCVDREDLESAVDVIESVRPELQPEVILTNARVASLAIFGPDFRERPGIAGQMFRCLAHDGVNILAISTSISTVNCIIGLDDLPTALAAVHAGFEVP
jgi:aspartate kinase